MSRPELVVLFADVDAQRFVSSLIRRGVERRCLRPFSWEAVREPMRDARLAQQPLAAAVPFRHDPDVRFLVLWDHHGSGRDDRAPDIVEQEVMDIFARADISADRVAAVAFVPEFEAVLAPVWERVLSELSAKRAELPRAIAFDGSDPKSSVKAAVEAHRLRADAALYDDLGSKLSLEALKKGDALARVAARLVEWFGAP